MAWSCNMWYIYRWSLSLLFHGVGLNHTLIAVPAQVIPNDRGEIVWVPIADECEMYGYVYIFIVVSSSDPPQPFGGYVSNKLQRFSSKGSIYGSVLMLSQYRRRSGADRCPMHTAEHRGIEWMTIKCDTTAPFRFIKRQYSPKYSHSSPIRAGYMASFVSS